MIQCDSANSGKFLSDDILRLIEHMAGKFIRSVELGREDQEDLQQDVALIVWQRRHAFDPCRAMVSTFVGQIGRARRN